jgi:multiple sugar transport system substrate-binding protein
MFRDDFINVMQTVHGQDLNGDGIPDYGACVETKNQTGWIPSSYFIWTIAAPMLQSKGTKQGLFFDATTMEIMANTTAFRTAAQILREIARHSPIEDIRNLWTEGRCALALDWGDIAVRSQLNISVVANVTGMSLTPGSRTVYNRDTQQMEECTQELCPHMDSFGLNRAPYAAALGWTMAISRFIPDSRLQAAYDFLSYVSQPSHSIESVLLGLGWDLVRDSQMNPQIFLDVGFSNLTATTMINSNKGAQNSLNAVADLPLEKYSEYTLALGEKLSQFLYDEISLDEFQSSTVAAWDALLDKYGRREQHVAYALFIGAPRPIFDYEVTLPDALRIAFVAISGVCIAIAIGLVVFIVIHRNKKVSLKPTRACRIRYSN